MIDNDLKYLLESRNLNITKAAAGIGISRSALSNLINKSYEVASYKVETLNKIADFFGVTFDDILLYFPDEATVSIDSIENFKFNKNGGNADYKAWISTPKNLSNDRKQSIWVSEDVVFGKSGITKRYIESLHNNDSDSVLLDSLIGKNLIRVKFDITKLDEDFYVGEPKYFSSGFVTSLLNSISFMAQFIQTNIDFLQDQHVLEKKRFYNVEFGGSYFGKNVTTGIYDTQASFFTADKF